MEIIIAVIIISIVGVALLQVDSNSHKIYTKIFHRTKANQNSSIVFIDFSEKIDKKELQVSEILKERYFIDNDDILKVLKEKKIFSSKKLINSIEPLANKEDGEEDNGNDEDDENKQKPLTIDIYNLTTKIDGSSRSIYTINIDGEL